MGASRRSGASTLPRQRRDGAGDTRIAGSLNSSQPDECSRSFRDYLNAQVPVTADAAPYDRRGAKPTLVGTGAVSLSRKTPVRGSAAKSAFLICSVFCLACQLYWPLTHAENVNLTAPRCADGSYVKRLLAASRNGLQRIREGPAMCLQPLAHGFYTDQTPQPSPVGSLQSGCFSRFTCAGEIRFMSASVRRVTSES